jgi:Ca2+-binding EF-hand superfamily protein
MKSTTRWLAAALLLASTTAFAEGGDWQAKREAMQAQAFAQADADGNGSLSPQEFANYNTILQQQRGEHKFTRLDANGDGQVTLEELQAAPAHHHGCKGQGQHQQQN